MLSRFENSMIFFSDRQNHAMVFFIPSERWRVPDSPSDPPRRTRGAPPFRRRRARCACSASSLACCSAWAEIAAEEGFSRERLRQIIRAATAPGRGHDGPDHKRMQIALLTPALHLAADGVAQGGAKSIPLLKIIDRLDRTLGRRRRRPIGHGASRLPLASLPAEQVLENAQNGKG